MITNAEIQVTLSADKTTIEDAEIVCDTDDKSIGIGNVLAPPVDLYIVGMVRRIERTGMHVFSLLDRFEGKRVEITVRVLDE